MKKQVAITGAKGTIGTILRKELHDLSITPLDRPRVEVGDYEKLLAVLPNHDVVIHLAWDTKRDNWKSGRVSADNTLMTENVYRAAKEGAVPRVIMASSVHANAYSNWRGPERIFPNDPPVPDSPYGAHKVFMEALGRYYASVGLEVICIRFGGVNVEDKPNATDERERSIYLSHRDCGNLLRACIEAQSVPHNFVIIYAVSDNKGRRHDITNPFGWKPKDSAAMIEEE